MYSYVYFLKNSEYESDIINVYINEYDAYKVCMDYNLQIIIDFQEFIKQDPIIHKQPVKSIHKIQKLYKINDKKEQLKSYLDNLSDIYDYFYDGGNECWQTYKESYYYIEKMEIIIDLDSIYIQ